MGYLTRRTALSSAGNKEIDPLLGDCILSPGSFTPLKDGRCAVTSRNCPAPAAGLTCDQEEAPKEAVADIRP